MGSWCTFTFLPFIHHFRKICMLFYDFKNFFCGHFTTMREMSNHKPACLIENVSTVSVNAARDDVIADARPRNVIWMLLLRVTRLQYKRLARSVLNCPAFALKAFLAMNTTRKYSPHMRATSNQINNVEVNFLIVRLKDIGCYTNMRIRRTVISSAYVNGCGKSTL